jgi:hypothetical protein
LVPDRVHGSAQPVPHPDLAVQAPDVPAHGLWTDEEMIGNLVILKPLTDQPQDLALAQRQLAPVDAEKGLQQPG